VPEACETDARFAYVSREDAAARLAHIVEATRLRAPGGVVATPPLDAYRGRVERVEWGERLITLSEPLPALGGWVGSLVYFRNGPHRSAYHIREVLPGRTAIRLDLDGLIYRGGVTESKAGEAAITVEVPPRIPGNGGVEPHSYYDGAWVTDERGRASHRIAGLAGTRMTLAEPLAADAFGDADADGRRRVLVYDVGPGDRITIPRSTLWRAGDE
jgi:hypothetical protein